MQKKQNNKPKTKVSKQIVKINAPVATTRITRFSAPKIKNLRDEVRVNHREFIRDITGKIAFSSSQVLAINPGLGSTFPWLAAMATRFESFRFNSLKFLYETSAPTSTTGTVILAMDYDPADLAPLTKTQALSYESSVRSAPWKDCVMTCSPKDLRKRSTYYTRNNAVVTNDLQLYDVGNLFVCVSGQAADDAIIGELYVEYDITLLTPQLEALSGTDRFITGGGVLTPGVSPFGTTQVMKGGLPVSVSSGDISKLNFATAGDYLLVWIVVGTGLADAAWSVGSGILNTKITGIASGGTNYTYVARVRVTDPLNALTGPDTALWTTITTSKVYVTPAVYTDLA